MKVLARRAPIIQPGAPIPSARSWMSGMTIAKPARSRATATARRGARRLGFGKAGALAAERVALAADVDAT